ncbi:hypothetical protein [Streptomyces sp. NPDC048272]|uniref:hypothetical protein n=1 Tax=Streptomyces sp. NPDC048272 TaxID=3154616 RepID=UPI00343027E4
MSQRNRAVQREARKIRDRQAGTKYTGARTVVRDGWRLSRIHPGPAVVDGRLWSRWGRWIFETADWRQWRFRTGCGHVQSAGDVPPDAGSGPELAVTQCLLHGSGADPALCPPVGTEGSKYYRVSWWNGHTRVLPFALDSEYVLVGPLTDADDGIVSVPGITDVVDPAVTVLNP